MTRSYNYLVTEAIVAAFFVATVFTVDWAYQSGILAKGTALGLSALFLFVSSVAVVGLAIDLIIVGFHTVFSKTIDR